MTEKIIEEAAKKHDLAGLAGLVFVHGLNEEPYTTDKIIAEHSGNSLHAVKVLIYNHKQDFEDFGILSFEMTKLPGRGRPQKTYHLNEQQATLLITYLDNTPQVNQFIEKPQRKTLMAAVKSWPNANQWSYRNMTQLLLKRATGLTAKQIKHQRHVSNSLDGLTPQEQERYSQLENIAIGLVSLNKTWDEVKGVLLLA